MVNLDKWEEITYDDIKIGDEIKRINVHTDGTRAEVIGVVARENFGTFESVRSFALVRRHYENSTTELYRRKISQEEIDAKFVFPEAPGAVIEANQGIYGTRRYVHTGLVWHWTDTRYPASLSETDLRRKGSNFKVISEGIK